MWLKVLFFVDYQAILSESESKLLFIKERASKKDDSEMQACQPDPVMTSKPGMFK